MLEAFLRLYDEGLIYRGRYIVNWCPRCRTALSDLEVVHQERQGHLWHIRYPVVGSTESLVVATTRPETMLGDTAVAVHPDDERYQHLVGKKVLLPLMNREIPIIADAYVDREFGTGAVKVTPAHDPNDFEMGRRHNLPQIDVMTDDGKMSDAAGPYAGLDRFEARKRIVEDLQAQGLLERVADHALAVGDCDRCKTVVEPRALEQWFVQDEGDGRAGLAAVERGDSRSCPRISAPSTSTGWPTFATGASRASSGGATAFPSGIARTARRCTGARLARRDENARQLRVVRACESQDNDVLDTWFSSGAVAFFHARLAGRHAGLARLLSHQPADQRLRHPFFLGRADDHDGPAPDEDRRVTAFPSALYLHALVRDPEGAEDVQDARERAWTRSS